MRNNITLTLLLIFTNWRFASSIQDRRKLGSDQGSIVTILGTAWKESTGGASTTAYVATDCIKGPKRTKSGKLSKKSTKAPSKGSGKQTTTTSSPKNSKKSTGKSSIPYCDDGTGSQGSVGPDCEAIATGTTTTANDAIIFSHSIEFSAVISPGFNASNVFLQIKQRLQSQFGLQYAGCDSGGGHRRQRMLATNGTTILNILFGEPQGLQIGTCPDGQNICASAIIDNTIYYTGNEPSDICQQLGQAIDNGLFNGIAGLQGVDYNCGNNLDGNPTTPDTSNTTPTGGDGGSTTTDSTTTAVDTSPTGGDGSTTSTYPATLNTDDLTTQNDGSTPGGSGNNNNGNGTVAGIQGGQSQSIDNGIGAGPLVAIAFGSVAFVLLLLFAGRRHSTRRVEDEVPTDALKHRQLTEDEDDGFTLDEEKGSLAQSPQRLAHVVGESDSIISRWSFASGNMSPAATGGVIPSDEKEFDIATHSCSSPTCEICEQKRQQGVTFLPTNTTHLNAYRQNPSLRPYPAADTVTL